MIGRRQLAVASPISGVALARAFARSMTPGGALAGEARALVEEHFGASIAVLTDSGTSALVLALRLALPSGGIVGFPAFACVDLVAAAQLAGVRVRLYDLDPATLSPDLDSLDRMLARGVDAVVVAHLYGFPADIPAVLERAARRGVPVIEDAAQGAGGTLHGKRLGTFGDLTVLSFGRGKGLCAGGGGALLARDAAWTNVLNSIDLPAPSRGWGGLAKTAVQWMLGRPSMYAIPSLVPWLHLGEMVYHRAHEPASISKGSSVLLASALALEPKDLAGRRERAAVLRSVATSEPTLAPILELSGAVPGFLRYPVRDVAGRRAARPSLGVLRSYPSTMAEQGQLVPILVDNGLPVPGAVELRRSLFTLPTHRFVDSADMAALAAWLVSASAPVQTETAARRAEHAGAHSVEGASRALDGRGTHDSDVTSRRLPR